MAIERKIGNSETLDLNSLPRHTKNKLKNFIAVFQPGKSAADRLDYLASLSPHQTIYVEIPKSTGYILTATF